jgi:hypothetical protein
MCLEYFCSLWRRLYEFDNIAQLADWAFLLLVFEVLFHLF